MGLLQALRVNTNTHINNNKHRKGQSLLEMALALPVMLIMISGLIEFGFALNQYLNALDAAREAARYATDSDPLDRDFEDNGADPPVNNLPLVTEQDCGTSLDFYMQAACIAQQTMSPVDFNPATDDVVISVFRVLSGTVIDRWPNCEPTTGDDCPNDPSPFADTLGEWHLYGRGSGCGLSGAGNGFDDDGDGQIDDSCDGSGVIEGPGEGCVEATDDTCHISRFDNALVESKLDEDAPDSAVLLVEVFYDYPHVMALPWITPFVPNPLPLHTYTIGPLPAAEPSLTVTGTVSIAQGDGSFVPVSGATITLNNGMIAITDSDGQYIRTGLSSATYQLTADTSGTTCSVAVPNPATVTLTLANVYDVNFVFSSCVTPTPTHDVPATNVAGSATAVQQTVEADATNAMATATSVAGTQTAMPGPTETPGGPPTDTATAPATCTAGAVSNTYSSVTVADGLAQADNSDTVEVTVLVKDECNVEVAGATVSLSSDRGGSESITPPSASTDGSGVATFNVVSSLMSNWNSGTRSFDLSTYTAVANGVTISDTGGGAFACVGGIPGTAANGDEIVWTFMNDTTIDRRLLTLSIVQSYDFSLARELNRVEFDGIEIWNVPGYSDKPALMPTGAQPWIVGPSRVIPAGATLDLLVGSNIGVSGGDSFNLTATWDNGSGISPCTSLPVIVTR